MRTLMVACGAIVACSSGERSQSGIAGHGWRAQRSDDTSPRADERRISQCRAHLILFESETVFWSTSLSLWCLTVLCAASGSCSDGNSPSGVIIFEAGNQQADTAYAELTQALRVRIFGAPSGTIVRFQSLPVDTGPPRSSVYVAAPSAPFYDFLADSTDHTGETSARIKLGTVAGQGRLQVSVPELDLVDTGYVHNPARANGAGSRHPG